MFGFSTDDFEAARIYRSPSKTMLKLNTLFAFATRISKAGGLAGDETLRVLCLAVDQGYAGDPFVLACCSLDGIGGLAKDYDDAVRFPLPCCRLRQCLFPDRTGDLLPFEIVPTVSL